MLCHKVLCYNTKGKLGFWLLLLLLLFFRKTCSFVFIWTKMKWWKNIRISSNTIQNCSTSLSWQKSKLKQSDSEQGLTPVSYIPRVLWTNKPVSFTSSQETQLTYIHNIRLQTSSLEKKSRILIHYPRLFVYFLNEKSAKFSKNPKVIFEETLFCSSLSQLSYIIYRNGLV